MPADTSSLVNNGLQQPLTDAAESDDGTTPSDYSEVQQSDCEGDGEQSDDKHGHGTLPGASALSDPESELNKRLRTHADMEPGDQGAF